MSTRKQKDEARRLWMAGEGEASIAAKLGLDVPAIESWRDAEDWGELRQLLDARVAAKRHAAADNADERDLILVDALDNLLAKVIQRGGATATAQEVHRIAAALKIGRAVREDIRLSRLDRELREQL